MPNVDQLQKFTEVYEVVATRVVWIGDRMFRIEIRKRLKGNLTGRYDCAYYEDKELEKGKKSDAKSCWCSTSLPSVYELTKEAAMQKALGFLAEAFSRKNRGA